MKARGMLALAIAVLLVAWFFMKPREPQAAVEGVVGSRPLSTAPLASTSQAPSTFEVVAQTDARVPVALDQAPESPAVIAGSARAGPRLYGFVLPIVGKHRIDRPVTVGLTDPSSKKQFVEVGPDGAYSFTIEATGHYWVVAESIVAGEVRRGIDFDVTAGDRRLDLQLELPLEIQLQVVDRAGEPIRGVELLAVATSEPPGEWLDVLIGGSSTTFDVGVWTAGGDSEGPDSLPIYSRVRLFMPPPVFISIVHAQRVVATQRVEVGQASVRFVLDSQAQLLQKGSLRLRMIDAQTRQPLALNLQVNREGMVEMPRTGLDGIYSGTFSPGWLGVKLLGGRYESPDLNVRIEPGVLTDLGDVALGPGLSISGMVVDEFGRGVAARMFFDVIEPTTGEPLGSGFVHAFLSSAQGDFRIGGLSHRRYQLRMDNHESTYGIQSAEVDLSAGSVEGLRIELATGIPLVIRPSDERWPMVRYSVFNEHGTRICFSRLYGQEPQEILLAPGQYEIEVRMGESGEPSRRKITIAHDPVELLLP